MHDTPAGPVLEGQFVDHNDPPPLPRRAGSGPIPSPSRPSDAPRPAGTRPSPRPRFGEQAGAATATVDPETAPDQRAAPDHEVEKPAAAGPPASHDERQRSDTEIDLPLDGDPEPAPEYGPDTRSAVAHGLVTPPPADVPHFVPPQREDPSTANEPTPAPATPPAEAARTAPPPSDIGKVASAGAAAVAAAAAAGVAAFRRKPKDSETEDSTTVPQQRSESASPRPWTDLGNGYEPDDHTDEVITAYPSARPGPAGAIHGVGLTVLVTGLERSVRFYRDVLGFFEIDRGDGNAVLASGDTRLVLRTVTDLTAAGRLVYLNLEVGDIEAVYRELSSKGVAFQHEPMVVNHGDKLELWSATFYDPDGHNIAITQWRATR